MAATKMVFHHMVLIFHSFKDFSDLEDFWARRLPYDFQEDFHTTFRKSSRRLLRSLLTESSDGVFSHIFNQMVLIFHLDMYFVCSIKIWIRLWKTYGKSSRKRLRRSLPDDFKEVFQSTSKKSSSRLQRSLPDDFKEVFQTTSRNSSDEVVFHIKRSLSLSL
ncbi:hypothetical protein IGI04_035460 [Brassica rapa subsp. trilocularis]|uniref:Uncharacterized protein n=1 Tax=Brassica rapa subsp. trilocularis TaxID=1813537 RepID=A0ABQ7LDJ2_BRACM|nr:hypothetical protein IGI04_035460 [Brassica rapa subsp. trilocularis]